MTRRFSALALALSLVTLGCKKDGPPSAGQTPPPPSAGQTPPPAATQTPPPAEAPPVEAPPAEVPPVEAPPVEAPPVEAPPAETPPAAEAVPGGPTDPPPPQPPTGLVFKLADAAGDGGAYVRPPLAVATPMAQADATALLSRLPPLEAGAADDQEFAFRPRSLPAPRTGDTVKDSFPPAPAKVAPPTEVESGPLEVRRYGPEGDVPIAAQMSVTFSQPMVAITSHDDLAKLTPPVKLTPSLEGQWRWIGAKTLLFDPKIRLPMATEFTATVDAGTASATGGVLEKAVSWTFRTPPVQLVGNWPTKYQPTGLRPVIVLRFDQRVHAEDVLKTIAVKYGFLAGAAPIRLATDEELEADPSAKSLMASSEPGRSVAVVPQSDLPEDTEFKVVLGKGTASAEGPRLTETEQSFAFRTYGPMRFKRATCGWNQNCPPLMPWTLEFTNRIDPELFDEKWVTVSPELPGMTVTAMSSSIMVQGPSKGRTKYTIKVSKALKDIYGQTLNKDVSTDISVTKAEPVLVTPSKNFLLLDPAGLPEITMSSINHKTVDVKVYKVEPKDFRSFLNYAQTVRYPKDRKSPPGKMVIHETVSIKMVEDEMIETPIELGGALDAGHGSVLVVIRPTIQPNDITYYEDIRAIWVQRSDLAVDAVMDGDTLYGIVTDLKTGAGVPGATVTLEPGTAEATTDEHGIATIQLPSAADEPKRLVARKDGDVVFLTENAYYWSSGSSWIKREQAPTLRWFVFDDRGLYRPKETVHFKGWIRVVSGGKMPMVGPLGSAAKGVAWTLFDARNNELAKGTVPLTAAGGFDGSFSLPDTMNLGNARLVLSAQGAEVAGGTMTHMLKVQEFRRPEFEVRGAVTDGPHTLGGTAQVSVSASYFAGGALPGADVQWYVSASQTSFTPPNRWDYAFGTYVPWWWSGSSETRNVPTMEFKGITDSAGTHRLELAFESINPPRPWSVSAEGTVQDVNRQTFTTSQSLIVHPADRYVGIKSKRDFLQKGEELDLLVIVTDLDGTLVSDVPVALEATRLEWTYKKGVWAEEERDTQKCDTRSLADTDAHCVFAPKEGGTWRVRARIKDASGRPNETQRNYWVPGGKQPIERDVKLESVRIVPDKKEYAVGDTAELFVTSPFSPAEGLVTVRVSGIVEKQTIRFDGSSALIKVPIAEGYMPSVSVVVDVTGSAPRMNDKGDEDDSLPRRPAHASGGITLAVPAASRTLTVEPVPDQAETEPGAANTVTVSVKDASGAPVEGAEVAVVIVDESVLALTGYRIGDPVDTFYGYRGYFGQTHRIRELLLLQDPMTYKQLATAPASEHKLARMEGASGGAPPPPMAAPAPVAPDMAEAPMLEAAMDDAAPTEAEEGGEGGDDGGPIAVRKNFDPLAVFAASVTTDANGVVQVPVKLPDNLTRYRVTAVAVEAGTRFGTGESTITARLPLMVRPSAPRFLNFGDVFELPVVLQNQTKKALEVNIAVASTGVTLTEGQGRHVTVPPMDRVEVRFPATTAHAGTGRFQIGAQSGKWSDAAKLELPIWTPATTEAFATYGTIDKGAVAQPVKLPPDVYTQFGGLEVSSASTNLQALTDAVLYLVSYPFECSEQVSSRILAVAAMKDVLTAFDTAGLPSPDEMVAAVGRDLKRLELLQHDNGGFSFWKRSERDWPYLTVHVLHAMARAKQKGFEVSPRMLQRAQTYVKNIRSHFPREYTEDIRDVIESYGLYVRNLLGDKDTARARALLAKMGGVKKASLEAVGWLLNVMTGDAASASTIAEIHRHLLNNLAETAGAAHFVTSYGDNAYLILHSDRRVDGILLEALIGSDEKSDIIPKLVEGLLGHRTKGHWLNTQENVFILLALDRYFNTYEKVTPNFVARVWLGAQYAGDHTFKGRTTERHQIDIPMRQLTAEQQDLIIQKDGAGRLYYRVGMRYAPKNLKLEPADHGFYVQRTYESVDKPEDVKKDENGVWHVKAGARVRVKLTMVNEGRRTHVALVDPLPAGFEALNPDLLGAQRAAPAPSPNDEDTAVGDDDGPYGGRGYYGRWWGPWYEHENLRDERVEAFTTLLWGGVHTYTYVARATTPGTFVVPPTKAEEMYMPETFGRSASEQVVVE